MYRRSVEGLLGKDVIACIFEYVRQGMINEQQISDIARLLESDKSVDQPNILFGNHKRRMARDRNRASDEEMREILSDWWNISCYQMTRETAMDALIKALSHSDVNCRPLVARILSFSTVRIKVVTCFGKYTNKIIRDECSSRSQKSQRDPQIGSPGDPQKSPFVFPLVDPQ